MKRARRASRLWPWLLAVGVSVGPGVLAAGCGDDDEGTSGEPEVSGRFVVLTTSAHEAVVKDFLDLSPIEGAVVAARVDPARELGRGSGEVRVALVDDGRCAGCYRVEGSAGRYTVKGGGVLGVQYGLAQLLEEMGVRFFHPWRSHVPATLASPDASVELGRDHQPEMELRGLHLHTLHPIESYFDLWEPGEASLAGARRLIDWTVKNRGNHIQWPALNNIKKQPAHEAWRAHTRAILDYAHQRGVTVGIGVQLYGTSSLQLSLTLLPSATAVEPEQTMRENLSIVTDGLPFDQLSLAFGEFSKSNPDGFVNAVNLARKVQLQQLPQAGMHAIIHVGNYPDLRINYQGESLLYYFLVKYVDPSIVPWVHTVMYYNLFEDAGGAYLHDQFDEHRAYTVQRLQAGQPVAYQPESAYWVAFDNSVPTYLPLYLRSRHVDVAQLRAAAGTPLRQHVLFTSGWEWGYWQNDYATLRLNYELPGDWRALTTQMFAPWGASGQALSDSINALADVQHDALLENRLAAYLAGRDSVIDVGAKVGKIAAPDRVAFSALASMSEAERTDFETRVVAPLEALAQATEAQRAAAAQASLAGAERFQAEVVDGMEITARRATFVAAAYRAALAGARGQPTASFLATMEQELTAAQAIVARRHADLHSPRGAQLFTEGPNATAYAAGYLIEAHTLCYWRRERWQVRGLLLGEAGKDPSCVP